MGRLTLSSPLTHSDWMLKKDGPAWGPDGIRHMRTRCWEFGFDEVFWRCYDCGRSPYASRLTEPFRWDDHEEVFQYSPGSIPPPDGEALTRWQRLGYSNFDTLAAAVETGHELGLEVHGWLTINEDDHGLGWPSRFTREHPGYRWVRRSGERYHSQLSFAFPEGREYKLDPVREGLVDTLLASGYYVQGGTPEQAYAYMVEQTEGRLPLTLSGWVPNSDLPWPGDAVAQAHPPGVAQPRKGRAVGVLQMAATGPHA